MRRRPQSALRSEATILAELLEEAHALKTIEVRTWTAPWLLSPIHDPVWRLRTDDSVLIDGEWRAVITIDWDDKLPDGSKLTDECNQRYLEFLQRSAFLLREEILDIRASSTHAIHISILKALTHWIFSQSNRFSPAEHGFSKVDASGIHDFMKKYIAGGLFEVGDYGAKFLKSIDKELYSKWNALRPKPSIRVLPKDIVDSICKKLDYLGFYSVTEGIGPNSGLKYVDRTKVAELMQADVSVMKIPGASVFFRQFEPEYIKKFGRLMVRVAQINHKFLSHRTYTIDQVNSNKPTKQIAHTITTIRCLEALSETLPLSLRPLAASSLKSPLNRYLRDSDPGDHTPWIPLETSFVYLNESLRWILEYGEPLVDFYLKASKYFKESSLLISGSPMERIEARELWTQENMPEKLKSAGITGWSSFRKTRIHGTAPFPITKAMTIFLGACIYIISGVLPARIDEIVSLEKTCISFTDGDGFWLRKRRGKAVENDQHHSMDVPVPQVVATAIGLLIRIGVKSREFVSGYKELNQKFLFYLPIFHSLETQAIKRRDDKSIQYALDIFCDHIGLPPDELGRRWYVRIHENRKAFLLSFVWYFKSSSLDAARWLAGHTDPNHILAYIKANIPGEEISELEADFLAEMLWDFGISPSRKPEVRNISALYRRVKAHFHVREISEVNQKELNDYLEYSLFEGKIHIDVINLITRTGKQKIALRFRISK
ncbi:hypothetical protein [Burkholderia sp. Ax-1719]|uniref:hypothetical protein n=1 Tax=Burkholderia sp. Ax-1719 TaxID=2608334 RepID=UPI001422E005|nr:hypothetical protein [Burkholderia sp. Ax-1719]NIE66840.1 hypothetical protein [Burkholderia sp. Ax-1719]